MNNSILSKSYRRPESLTLPTTWLMFEGKKSRADGSASRFRVEDVTDDKAEEIIEFAELYLKEEPFAGANFDLPSLVKCWQAILKQRVSLQCVTDDEERKLVAFNICEIVDSPISVDFGELNNHPCVKMLRGKATWKNEINLLGKWNLDAFLDAFGLFVIPEYRGQGIANQVLRARIPLCKSLGIKATANTFSSDSARNAATKIGFEIISELRALEMRDRLGLNIDGIDKHHVVKYMALKITQTL